MDFLEYLQGEGLTLQKKGLSYWCSCPFHRDDTPSMQVTPKGGGYVWYCFSCKRGGGPTAFISEHQGVPEHEARRVWARLTGRELPDTDRDTLTRVVESLAVNGHPFLRDRGITDDTCRKYGIGYCEDYGRLLAASGLSEDEASSLGLFDLTGRIVYPFYDSEGVYKIAARSVDHKDYKNSDKEAKWSRDGLWGLHLLRGDTAWVFEGYHDAMVARQMGYQSVAACGTNMTRGMWEELKSRGVRRVVFAPDGDQGGRSWLERLALEAPFDTLVEFVALEHGDPDDALLAGTFMGLVPQAPFEWFVSRKETGTLAERVRALSEAAPVWARMPPEQRALCRGWFKERFGDDEALDHLHVAVEPDLEAERVVLADCLYSKNIRLDTMRELEAWHFHGKAHSNVWELIREREATPQMVQVALGVDLSDSADLVNYRFYIDRVKEVGTRARVIKVLAAASPSNVGAIVEELYSVVDKVSTKDSADLARELVDTVNSRVHDPRVLGVPIPAFPTLNKALLGLCPQRLVLMSGNSGHGKTTTACNMMDGLIDEHETLFVTLEMTEHEVMEKLACIRSGIPSMKVATGSLTQDEYDAFVAAAESISRSKLQVVYGVNDLYKLVALVKAHVMRRQTRFVFIDYLQLISVPTKEDRWDQLARITKTLKTQVARLGPTVFGITQLKRSALNSDVPDAADQAGAYAMLADADHAITVRKVDPKESKDGSNYLMHLSKSRFGIDNVVIPCVFDRATQRISEIE